MITLEIEPSGFVTFVDYALIPFAAPKSGSSLVPVNRFLLSSLYTPSICSRSLSLLFMLLEMRSSTVSSLVGTGLANDDWTLTLVLESIYSSALSALCLPYSISSSAIRIICSLLCRMLARISEIKGMATFSSALVTSR